jgi:hypothetical protein
VNALSDQSDVACVAGPEGCDPSGGELVRCAICGEPCCDFHGDYPSNKAYAEGDWRCPDHAAFDDTEAKP